MGIEFLIYNEKKRKRPTSRILTEYITPQTEIFTILTKVRSISHKKRKIKPYVNVVLKIARGTNLHRARLPLSQAWTCPEA